MMITITEEHAKELNGIITSSQFELTQYLHLLPEAYRDGRREALDHRRIRAMEILFPVECRVGPRKQSTSGVISTETD